VGRGAIPAMIVSALRRNAGKYIVNSITGTFSYQTLHAIRSRRLRYDTVRAASVKISVRITSQSLLINDGVT